MQEFITTLNLKLHQYFFMKSPNYPFFEHILDKFLETSSNCSKTCITFDLQLWIKPGSPITSCIAYLALLQVIHSNKLLADTKNLE